MCRFHLCVDLSYMWRCGSPHIQKYQISLMCGSHLHVVHRWFWLLFFLESGGELCIYTLAHVQKYPSRAKLSHMWISRVVSVHKTLPNATSLFNVMTSFDSRDLLPRRCLLHFKWYRICTAYRGDVHALKSWTGILLFLELAMLVDLHSIFYILYC